MSLPRYPKYKDSGVEWLGEVPEHWEVSQSRRIFAVRSEPALQADRMLTASQKYGVLFQSDFVEIEGRRVAEVIKGVESLRHVEPDDFIISMRSFQGGLEWCKLRGSTSFHYVMIKPVKNVRPPFFAHLFKSTAYIQALRTTTDLIRDGQELRYSNFVQVPLPVVPLDEQTQIAAFLDRETAKIDELVAEQRRLMALLKEKRLAVISHAVTRGLNPDAPMKPSGIEWVGHVPVHWGVGALGYLAAVSSGSTPDRGNPAYWGGEIPWIKTGEIDYLPIFQAEESITKAGLQGSSAKMSEPGTMLMAMYGQGVTRGRVAILEVAAAYNQACAAISFGSRIDARFAQYFFIAGYHFIRDTGNETSQMNLSTGIIQKFQLTVPPVGEQCSIISHLDNETSTIDILTTEAQRAITLLQERRTALISAAVTGQIDVRGVVAA